MDTKNKIFWKEFIENYRNHNCLWNTKSTDYTNQVIRAMGYDALLDKLKEINSFATLDYLKKKINNIRTSFRREYKKVQDSKKRAITEDEIYEPTLWYYHLLLFTVPDENDKTTISYEEDFDRAMDSDEISIDVYEDEYCEDPLLTPALESNAFITIKNEDICSPQTSVHRCQTLNSPVERKRKRLFKEENQLMESFHDDSWKREEDESSVIGKRIAFQLKGMEDHQKIIAEKLISDIMFYGKLGKLTESASIHCS